MPSHSANTQILGLYHPGQSRAKLAPAGRKLSQHHSYDDIAACQTGWVLSLAAVMLNLLTVALDCKLELDNSVLLTARLTRLLSCLRTVKHQAGFCC